MAYQITELGEPEKKAIKSDPLFENNSSPQYSAEKLLSNKPSYYVVLPI